MSTQSRAAEDAVVILYTNWRGETAVRRITPIAREWFGSSEWHPEPQWLFTAFDMDKEAFRDFARAGVKAWGQEAVDAALASPTNALRGIADDFMTSEQHHPGYVLIPAMKFEQLRAAEQGLAAPPSDLASVSRMEAASVSEHPKVKLVLAFDPSEFARQIAAAPETASELGVRIVQAMLTSGRRGHDAVLNAMGLANYGVTLEPLPAQTSDPASVSGQPAPVVPDEVRTAFEAAKLQEMFVDGDKADAYTRPPGSSFVNEFEMVARCACGPLWGKRAVAIAVGLNWIGTLLAATPSRRADAPDRNYASCAREKIGSIPPAGGGEVPETFRAKIAAEAAELGLVPDPRAIAAAYAIWSYAKPDGEVVYQGPTEGECYGYAWRALEAAGLAAAPAAPEPAPTDLAQAMRRARLSINTQAEAEEFNIGDGVSRRDTEFVRGLLKGFGTDQLDAYEAALLAALKVATPEPAASGERENAVGFEMVDDPASEIAARVMALSWAIAGVHDDDIAETRHAEVQAIVAAVLSTPSEAGAAGEGLSLPPEPADTPRFRDYSGRSDVETELVAELEAAGIPALDMTFKRDHAKVCSAILGTLYGWKFSRGWYYWIAEGPGIELAAAEVLHAAHPHTVRVAGHCGCPTPREWFKGLAVGSYHVDSPAGLKGLADTIRFLVDRAAPPPTKPRADAPVGGA